MEKLIVVMVPAIHSSLEQSKRFRSELEEALAKAETVHFDFHQHAAVSSLVLGHIIFGIKNHRQKIRFIHVSDFLMESLQTIIGPLAKELVLGPVKKLDIQLFSSKKKL